LIRSSVAAVRKPLHEVFDFADPALWRSNSFASLRPRFSGRRSTGRRMPMAPRGRDS